MKKNQPKEKIVLVGVLKNKRDLEILLRDKWYRIPALYAPKRQFNYLAFYQPASFDQQGKQIQYFAQVLDYQTIKRKDLLPTELDHPQSEDYYFRVNLDKIKKLPRPIKNIRPRRVSFGFTTLDLLLKSKNILQLYDVPPTEDIIENALKKASIKTTAQYYISVDKKSTRKRFCLDFAIFCKKGKIAIECDNQKAHSSPAQKKKDRVKDNFLRRCGWTVIRLKESVVLSNLNGCFLRIQKTIQKLGGPLSNS